jgi:hypothetical protein
MLPAKPLFGRASGWLAGSVGTRTVERCLECCTLQRQSQQLAIVDVQQLAAFCVRGRSINGFWSKNPNGSSLNPQTAQGCTG